MFVSCSQAVYIHSVEQFLMCRDSTWKYIWSESRRQQVVMHGLAHYSMMTCFLQPKISHLQLPEKHWTEKNSSRTVKGECGILQHEGYVDRSGACTGHSPQNSSVISDIGVPNADFFPPNKTTTLKLAPLPNTTAE